MANFSSIVRFTRPIQLLFALLTYGVGLGVAHYLGSILNLSSQFLGGLIIILTYAAINLLGEYFRPFNEPLVIGETHKAREQLRTSLLTVSTAFVAVAGILAFLLRVQGQLPLNAAILLLIYLFLGLAVAVPPVRLIDRGFGEIVQAFLLAALTPAIAYLLHATALHRLVTIFAIPLFLLALANLLATSFERYNEDLKYQRRNLLASLTWPRAVQVHNGSLLAAYLCLAAAPFLSIPFALIWPALLTLPIAAYQIFMLNNIAGGAKPIWPALNIAAAAVFGLTAYLITLTLWLR